MKKIISVVFALLFASTIQMASADTTVSGHLWSGVKSSSLTLEQAVLGVSAGLGGPASVNLAYDGASNALYTASASYKGLLSASDSLSVGLQAGAYGSILDGFFGQSALNCYSCAHGKSAIYAGSAGGAAFALQANEGNNYAGTMAYGLLPNLTVVGSANYDTPSNLWVEMGAAEVTAGPVTAVADAVYANSALDYGVAAKAPVYQNIGAFGKARKGGLLLVGPTYQATSNLLLAVLAGKANSADNVHYEARISANF